MYYLVRLKRKKPKILHESEREKEREREGWRERRGGREEKEEGGEEKKKDRIVTRFILFEPQEWGWRKQCESPAWWEIQGKTAPCHPVSPWKHRPCLWKQHHNGKTRPRKESKIRSSPTQESQF